LNNSTINLSAVSDKAEVTTDAVFSIKVALKKHREHNLETWVLFLDLVKAFDRVRELIWQILERYPKNDRYLETTAILEKDIQPSPMFVPYKGRLCSGTDDTAVLFESKADIELFSPLLISHF